MRAISSNPNDKKAPYYITLGEKKGIKRLYGESPEAILNTLQTLQPEIAAEVDATLRVGKKNTSTAAAGPSYLNKARAGLGAAAGKTRTAISTTATKAAAGLGAAATAIKGAFTRKKVTGPVAVTGAARTPTGDESNTASLLTEASQSDVNITPLTGGARSRRGRRSGNRKTKRSSRSRSRSASRRH